MTNETAGALAEAEEEAAWEGLQHARAVHREAARAEDQARKRWEAALEFLVKAEKAATEHRAAPLGKESQ